MKLGILIEVEEALDWDGWRKAYTAAESLGFESIWLSDHLASPWATRSGLETWTALAVAAAETEHLLLGPLVTPSTFREPAIVARMAASLASLSHDRLVVGLGLGWNTDEHAAAGIAFPGIAERRQRLARTIESIRCADPAVPILIGGSGPRATLPLVARYANQWNMTTGSLTDFKRASAQLDTMCDAIGRPRAEILRSIACGVLVGRDADDLQARAERIRHYVPPLAEADDVANAARGMGWLVGTVDEVSAMLREFATAGAERVVCGHYNVTDTQSLEMLAGLA